jgi:DNA replication regulator SLD3
MCDSINRKLGGPVILPSPKPTQAKSSSAKKLSKPGAAVARPAQQKPPRTLQRALSTDQSRRSVSRGPGNVIALMRSTTVTTIPGLKREGSEPVVGRGNGKGEPGHLRQRSSSGLLSRSNSIASLDVKAKKKAMVEAELQDAISALRKPNRELAGKAIVEAAEKRSSGGLSQYKSEFFFYDFHITNPRLNPSLTLHSRIKEANSTPALRDGSGQGYTSK